jgi:hypothetical protein
MIKTIVREITGSRRRLQFVGDAGIDVAGGAAVVLDACYPDACLSESARQNWDNEVKFKGIDFVYATDARVLTLDAVADPMGAFVPNGQYPAAQEPSKPAPPAFTRREPDLASEADAAVISAERLASLPKQAADTLSRLMDLADARRPKPEQEPSPLLSPDTFVEQ